MRGRYEMVADGSSFKLYTPYDPEFVSRFRDEVPSSAKRYVKNINTGKFDHWLISAAYADTVKSLCKQVYGYEPDVVGITTSQVEREYITFLEYIGLPRERSSGEVTASGWYNDGWNLIFSLAALEDWFNFKAETPKKELTFYEVLSIKPGVNGAELKSAYRRAARANHPDISSELDAKEQFQDIQEAYEILRDPRARRKYDACLVESKNVASSSSTRASSKKVSIGWRPPIRCGNLKVSGVEMAGRITVNKILAWNDVVNLDGLIMVTSWDRTLETFRVEWER